MLREYLEGDLRREVRTMGERLSTFGERMARIEAIQQASIQHQDLTDTQRLRLTAQGIQVLPGWAPPSSPPRRDKNSVFPKILIHLSDPKVLIPLSALIGWLSHHFVK
jgi:hypothetical protein